MWLQPLSSSQFGWNPHRLAEVVRKVVSEIAASFKAEELHGWLSSHAAMDDRLAAIFNLSVWLSPLIPDFSELGAYSKSLTALTYKQATDRMPNLLLVSAFGDVDVRAKMRFFLNQVEEADRMLSPNELKMIVLMDRKDRGPLLYWLLNERWLTGTCQRLIW